ncbi:hypothetical protein [Myxococcus xanthus]|uniref:hypothetical protein n=1 Tax=Myxococcus xanthus TaxID=34 RepID=UPI001CEDC93C|nr:hypothetical protein [Myxococcus xanthus]
MRTAPARMLSFMAALAVLLSATPSSAFKIPISEESYLNVAILLQPQLQIVNEGAPSGGPSSDMFLRRTRLLVFGHITQKLSFFAETDQPNFGKNGDWNVAFFIQDAFISYEVAEKVWIDVGMLLPPLTRHVLQGAVALQAVDYHSSLVRWAPGVGKVWRDIGVQVRGFAGPLGFRAAIFNGVNGKTTPEGTVLNPDDLPRVTAMARWNFFTREEDLFFQGIYFASEPRLSVGIGADYQPKAVATESGLHDALGTAADVFLDVPLANDQEFVFNATLFHYRQGLDNPQSGTGFYAETGWRFGKFQPLISGEYFKARVDGQDLLVLKPGFNIWFQKHTLNLRTEVAVAWTGDISQARAAVTGTSQLQLFY